MRTSLGLAVSLIAILSPAGIQAAPARKTATKKKSPAKPAPSHPVVPSIPLATGAFSVAQPIKGAGSEISASGPLTVRGLAGPVKWLRNSHYADANYPLFPPAPLPAGSPAVPGAGSGGMPEVPVLRPSGELKLEPARWVTLASGTRTLTVPVGAQETYPAVQLTPQVSGSVVPVGSMLPLGVTVTNTGSAARNWTLSYRALTASGASLASGTVRVFAGPMSRVTTPIVLGPVTIPGSITVSVSGTGSAGASGSASTGGGAVVPNTAVQSGEFPFGIVGGDLPLAASAGVQFWAGGWPWRLAGENEPAAGTRDEIAPGFSEGFFAEADRLGIALISRSIYGSPDTRPEYVNTAMNRFKRRAGGWAVPYTAELPPADYSTLVQSVYTTSKTIHKDSPTFLELPSAGTTGIEVAEGVNTAGATLSTDVFAVRGLGLSPSDEAFTAALTNVLALRDADYASREVWNLGETPASASTSPLDQAGQVVRSTLAQIAAGFDKVFWSSSPLLREDGSATPAYFGLSSLSGMLAGAEYVGSMPWEPTMRGEVFQKNGNAIMVAWSTGGTRPVILPPGSGPAPELFDSMQTRANLLISGRRLSLTPVPVYVTRIGKTGLADATATSREKRFQETRVAFEAIGVKMDENLVPLTNEEAVKLLQSAMDAYQPEVPRRNEVLNAVYHLLRLWDVEVLARAAARPVTDLIATNGYLDRANRASADLRVEMDYREGATNFQHEMRHLLNRVEDRMLLARWAYRQKDYALAQAHAEQMTLAARALIPYVKALPVGKP